MAPRKSDPTKMLRRCNSPPSVHRRESMADDTTRRETSMEDSFWDGVFGIIGIRNHAEVDYANLQVCKYERESIEQSLKVLVRTSQHFINSLHQ